MSDRIRVFYGSYRPNRMYKKYAEGAAREALEILAEKNERPTLLGF